MERPLPPPTTTTNPDDLLPPKACYHATPRHWFDRAKDWMPVATFVLVVLIFCYLVFWEIRVQRVKYQTQQELQKIQQEFQQSVGEMFGR